jgi:cullin-associated NEDD8-dissociated protein 1
MDSLSQVAYNIKTKKCLNLEDRFLSLIQAALLETSIKKDLVVTVDLGPFKHVVDNGTPVRKSAFQLLENIAEKFNFN